MAGRRQRSQPAKLDRSFAAQASRTDGLPLAFHSFHPRAARQSLTLGPGASGIWHLTSGVEGASARAEADLPDPDPSSEASGPRRKLLSLIPISIPISHVEWSRQRGTLPQKT